jgi:uncharacterized protein DUF4326
VTLPPQAGGWSRDERALAYALLDGRTVVVNVRRGGPHAHLVPWLVEQGRLTYVGHAGPRHSWPESDFANPFLRQVAADRPGMVARYREWLAEQPDLLRRLRAGELTGRALGCWCAPKACHADVLAEQADVR